MLDQRTLDLIRKTVFRYLDKKRYKVFIFGSWAMGDNRQYSDIDLGIEGKRRMPVEIKIKLEEEFERSDLPYMIEIVDLSQVSPSFKREALKKTICLN